MSSIKQILEDQSIDGDAAERKGSYAELLKSLGDPDIFGADKLEGATTLLHFSRTKEHLEKSLQFLDSFFDDEKNPLEDRLKAKQAIMVFKYWSSKEDSRREKEIKKWVSTLSSMIQNPETSLEDRIVNLRTFLTN